MRLELFKEPKHIPKSYVHDRYNIRIYYTLIYIGNYQNHPIYISEILPRSWVAQCGPCEEIYINDEVYGLLQLQKSPKFEEFLETICEHEVRYGYFNHECELKTDRGLEVLEFLKKQSIIKDYQVR